MSRVIVSSWRLWQNIRVSSCGRFLSNVEQGAELASLCFRINSSTFVHFPQKIPATPALAHETTMSRLGQQRAEKEHCNLTVI